MLIANTYFSIFLRYRVIIEHQIKILSVFFVFKVHNIYIALRISLGQSSYVKYNICLCPQDQPPALRELKKILISPLGILKSLCPLYTPQKYTKDWSVFYTVKFAQSHGT